MSIKYQNDCCNCCSPGYPCTGTHKRVKHLYCDQCGDECDMLYVVDEEQLCEYHALQRLEVVE